MHSPLRKQCIGMVTGVAARALVCAMAFGTEKKAPLLTFRWYRKSGCKSGALHIGRQTGGGRHADLDVRVRAFEAACVQRSFFSVATEFTAWHEASGAIPCGKYMFMSTHKRHLIQERRRASSVTTPVRSVESPKESSFRHAYRRCVCIGTASRSDVTRTNDNVRSYTPARFL